jgi:hypothetical protein
MLEDLKAAVAELSPLEYGQFRAWFEEFDATRLDEKIARDAVAGKLDHIADAAINALHYRKRT